MRLDDPSDNNGRGWQRLSPVEIADLIYIAIRMAARGVRTDFAGRNATKADEAAKKLAQAVSDRLAAYPVFGPARPAANHSAGCRIEIRDDPFC